MAIKVGVGGAQRELSSVYAGVNGVNRKLEKWKCGVAGVNRELLEEPPKPVYLTIKGAPYEYTGAAQVNTGDFYNNSVTIGTYSGKSAIISKLPYAVNGGYYDLMVTGDSNFVGTVTLYAEAPGAFFDGNIKIRSQYGGSPIQISNLDMGNSTTFEVKSPIAFQSIYTLDWNVEPERAEVPMYIWMSVNGQSVTFI